MHGESCGAVCQICRFVRSIGIHVWSLHVKFKIASKLLAQVVWDLGPFDWGKDAQLLCYVGIAMKSTFSAQAHSAQAFPAQGFTAQVAVIGAGPAGLVSA
ncbi:MAG: hypothetical protein WAN27_15070, partial [Xanthobacteraceae bacterium]